MQHILVYLEALIELNSYLILSKNLKKTIYCKILKNHNYDFLQD